MAERSRRIRARPRFPPVTGPRIASWRSCWSLPGHPPGDRRSRPRAERRHPRRPVDDPAAGAAPPPSAAAPAPVAAAAPAVTPTPAAPVTATSPVTTLKVGATGALVKDLQRALRRKGIRVSVDGAFGPATRIAVKKIQKRLRLRPTGIVDAALLDEARRQAAHRRDRDGVRRAHDRARRLDLPQGVPGRRHLQLLGRLRRPAPPGPPRGRGHHGRQGHAPRRGGQRHRQAPHPGRDRARRHLAVAAPRRRHRVLLRPPEQHRPRHRRGHHAHGRPGRGGRRQHRRRPLRRDPLHFELHPGGGASTDPYPHLVAVDPTAH